MRDAVKGFGLNLPETIQDDTQALAHLSAAYQEAARLRGLEPIAREYQQYQGEFRAWRQQQEQARQQQAAQSKQWFKAPEYDPRWESQLTRDPVTGEIRAAAGAPPDLPQRYAAWVNHQRDFMQKMAQDPIGAMKPGLEQLIQETAGKLIQQQMGGYREQQTAVSFVQENSGWLHARDQHGNIQRDQNGAPALSPLGRAFASHVYEAANMGLPQDGQQKYALACVQRDYALAMARQQQAPAAQNDAAKAAFLAQQAGQNGARVTGGATAAAGAVSPAGTTTRPRNKRDLEQLLMARMKEGGLMPGTPVDVG